MRAVQALQLYSKSTQHMQKCLVFVVFHVTAGAEKPWERWGARSSEKLLWTESKHRWKQPFHTRIAVQTHKHVLLHMQIQTDSVFVLVCDSVLVIVAVALQLSVLHKGITQNLLSQFHDIEIKLSEATIPTGCS